jgi:hypothetical protein
LAEPGKDIRDRHHVLDLSASDIAQLRQRGRQASEGEAGAAFGR